MEFLPKLSSYGRYSSVGHGRHTVRMDLDQLSLWFSYDTVVAFCSPGCGRCVSENVWGPTTGKHLNWIDGGGKAARARRVQRDEFEKLLQAAVDVYAGRAERSREVHIPETPERVLRL